MSFEVTNLNWITKNVSVKTLDSHTKVLRKIMFKNKIKRLPFIHVRLKTHGGLNVVKYASHEVYERLDICKTDTNNLDWLNVNIPILINGEATPIIVIDKAIWSNHSKYWVDKVRPKLNKLLGEHNANRPEYKTGNAVCSQL